MSDLKLFAFTCGMFQSTASFFVETDGDEIIRSPVPAYLIDHPKGLALFDTGLNVRFRRAADAKLGLNEQGFDIDEGAEIAARLRAIGVDPGAIRWIINSHLHADHCGGNASIPNATVVIQSRELAAARACEIPMLYDRRDYDHGHPILAIDGEHDLYGDGSVILFPTLGHTPGHQSVKLRLAKGEVVLAADCCYLARSLDELAVPALNLDREASLGTLKKLREMRETGTRIFYGHDRAFWEKVPQAKALS